ncbi:MAG: glycosyltransferase family 9 protein [Desulfarculus sp.]|nr:glycosyltransferase family 9 protein [Desulfarculus sp.]
MNSLLMRKIDRWAGVPLCWLCTLAMGAWAWLRPRPRPAGPPRRIVVIELAEIGGLVVAYPALAHLRRRFPQAEVYFLTFAGGQGILDLMGLIGRERQIIIRPEGLLTFLADTWAAIRRMRQLEIDATINLETFARFSTLLALLSGAARRAGFDRFHDEGRYLGGLITHQVIYNPHHHAAQTFLTLVEALAEEPDAEPRAKVSLEGLSLDLPRIETTPAAAQTIEDKLQALYPGVTPATRLVLINPNASDLVPVRRWPDHYFMHLVQGLLEDPGLLVVLTGTAPERPAAEVLRLALDSPRVLNLAGATTLPELIDLYNRASLLITNDSGPAHFASLTSLAVLVLFGPETPRIYGPLGPGVRVLYRGLACSPCVSAYNQKLSPCNDNRCLKQITPAEVLEKAREILGREPRRA